MAISVRLTSGIRAMLLAFVCATAGAGAQNVPLEGEPKADTSAPAPPPPIPGLKILFSGKADEIAANWEQKGQPGKWECVDGAMIATKPDSISTKDKYTDFQLHVEFRVPYLAAEIKGQERGNSGVFLQGRYEVQVLDSFGISDPGSGDCGAIYSIAAPLVNACKAPLQWQTFDIIYRAPRVDAATHALLEPPRATVLLNGILVQNQTVIPSTTHQQKVKPGEKAKPRELPAGYDTPGPISLQWHSSRVAFRNVWIVPLALKGADHY